MNIKTSSDNKLGFIPNKSFKRPRSAKRAPLEVIIKRHDFSEFPSSFKKPVPLPTSLITADHVLQQTVKRMFLTVGC